MRSNPAADTSAIRAVYDGVQRELYELFMGQQIHVGGYASSSELATLAGIRSGDSGVELCCGTGASVRLLVKLFGVDRMVGVELAGAPIAKGRLATERDGLTDRITFIEGDATATSLPDGAADFVWGEDAWCYVPEKGALIAEAARLLKDGGVIAFTDWVEGPAGLDDIEAEHVLQVMSFPNFESVDGYRALLESNGFDIERSEDTERFGQSFRLYAEMLRSQLGFDVIERFDFSVDVLNLVIEQLEGFGRLGDANKLIQGRFVARKRSGP